MSVTRIPKVMFDVNIYTGTRTYPIERIMYRPRHIPEELKLSLQIQETRQKYMSRITKHRVQGRLYRDPFRNCTLNFAHLKMCIYTCASVQFAMSSIIPGMSSSSLSHKGLGMHRYLNTGCCS